MLCVPIPLFLSGAKDQAGRAPASRSPAREKGEGAVGDDKDRSAFNEVL